ncbi:MAG: hypothetical protein ACI4DV_07300 [Lachnospiraceae bacterium]
MLRQKNAIITAAQYILPLFITSMICRILSGRGTVAGVTGYLLIFLAWTLGISCWEITMNRRLIHKKLKGFIVFTTAVMTVWMMVCVFRHCFTLPYSTGERFCRYLYSVSAMLILQGNYFGVLYIGEKENFVPEKAKRSSAVITGILILGILAGIGENVLWRSAGYIWGVFLVLLLFLELYRRAHASEHGKLLLFMSVLLLPCLICVIAELSENLLFPGRYLDAAFVGCAVNMFMWEGFIQTGLIPGNQDYRELLRQSDLSVQIVDSDYRKRYASRKAVVPDKETMRAAKDHFVLLDENTRLYSATIRGGYILWTENIAEENRVLEELEEARVSLAEKNALLQAETDLKKAKAKAEQQNKLYDNIAKEIEPALEQMEQQLLTGAVTAKEQREKLAKICVIGAYVKRRSNLILLSEDKTQIPSEELGYCLNESVNYLKVYGVYCTFVQQGKGMIEAEQAKLIYDFFHKVIMSVLSTVSTLLVSLVVESNILRLKMIMEDAKILPEMTCEQEQIHRMHGRVSVVNEDGVDYLTLTLLNGGGTE